MIEKEKQSPITKDRLGRAGHDAEMQMAFYLRRGFADAADVFVFNDLRLERNGEFAQIDHLVFHRYGFVIVESKSVVGTISVNDKGEFTRRFDGYSRGVPSPIRQARLQAELLSKLLNDHKQELRPKRFFGLVQKEFANERFRVLVAISDHGKIDRQRCDPPELFKADQIVEQIREFIRRHVHSASLTGFIGTMVADRKTQEEFDADRLPAYSDAEMSAIRRFLLKRHTPQQPSLQTARPSCSPQVASVPDVEVEKRLTCRSCASSEMTALHGRFGYYLKCNKCQGNTPIDQKCSKCAAKARIRKSRDRFTRICEACGTQVLVHINPE